MAESHFPVNNILQYWFGRSLEDPAELQQQSRRWFAGGKAVDHEIQMRFGDWLKPVAEAPTDHFDSPEALLAAVLVLDQFSRHLFRGRAEAFAFDDKALKLLDAALDKGWDRALHVMQRSFLYMPLQHAEDLQRQEQGVAVFEALLKEATAEKVAVPYQEFLELNLDYARQHQELIERFGRFPHRNEALGRASSPQEEAYLATDGRRFGQ